MCFDVTNVESSGSVTRRCYIVKHFIKVIEMIVLLEILLLLLVYEIGHIYASLNVTTYKYSNNNSNYNVHRVSTESWEFFKNFVLFIMLC
jgi:hypothetical protein